MNKYAAEMEKEQDRREFWSGRTPFSSIPVWGAGSLAVLALAAVAASKGKARAKPDLFTGVRSTEANRQAARQAEQAHLQHAQDSMNAFNQHNAIHNQTMHMQQVHHAMHGF